MCFNLVADLKLAQSLHNVAWWADLSFILRITVRNESYKSDTRSQEHALFFGVCVCLCNNIDQDTVPLSYGTWHILIFFVKPSFSHFPPCLPELGSRMEEDELIIQDE